MRDPSPFFTPLFVPGDRPDRFAKAAASGSDAIIIDLEDAVAASEKSKARDSAVQHNITIKPVIVRINGRTTPWFDDDLAALRGVKMAAVMLPKAQSAEDVRAVREALSGVPVVPLIETAKGLANLSDILAENGIVVAAFGSLDLALDLGCSATWEALSMARQMLVLACRLADLPPPLDGVTPQVHDSALVEADARRAADLGFGGKLVIHPAQIAPARSGFLPDEQAIAEALRIVEAGAGGATSVAGSMVDLPVFQRAGAILANRDR